MALESKQSDIALMLQVKGGDMDAFEVLHERYQLRVLGYFYKLCRNSLMANDLCQETFLRIWKVRKRYGATGSFPGYLFGVARMVWREKARELDKQRKLGIRCLIDDHLDTQSTVLQPDGDASRSELEQAIFRALDSLPEEQREVFILRSIEGLSLSEIAETLDCPLNTVRSRRILAVKKLRERLAGVFASVMDQAL